MEVKLVLESIRQSGLPEVIRRDSVIIRPTPPVRKIIALAGPRRAGKTYLLYQLAKELNDWYYVRFEDERLDISTSLLGEICAYVSGKSGNVFLDEIDKAPNWEVTLRRVADDYHELNFFVSSSSAKLAYEFLPSPLRGRTLSYEVLPLSFREFLRFKKVAIELMDEKTTAKVKNLLEEYLLFGGFPEVVLESNHLTKIELLNSYFETTVSVDVAEKFRVDYQLVKYAARMIRKIGYYSASKMFELFKSAGFRVGKETTLKLESFFSQVYYAAFVEVFSPKAKDILLYQRKPYLLDTGLIAFGLSESWWRLYENAVYLQLRRNKTIGEEINYWKSSEGYEVDFVVREGTQIKHLIQVCYDVEDEKTKKRETRAAIKAAKEFGITNITVITKNFDSEELVDDVKIKCTPLWKFLLGT